MSAKIELAALDKDHYGEWDDLVESSDQGTIFHKTHWLKTVAPNSFQILGCYKGGHLWGGIPIVNKRKLGMQVALHPFLTPYLGIVFRNHKTKYVKKISSERRIVEEIIPYLKNRFHFVDIMFDKAFSDLIPFYRANFFCTLKYTFILGNVKKLEDVWKNMDETARRDIRRSEKQGFRVVHGKEQFLDASEVVKRTFARQGKKPPFISLLNDNNSNLIFREQGEPFVVMDKKDRAVAAAHIVWDNRKAYYLFGGHDSERDHRGAAALVLWNAIKYTKENLDLDEFDFEGAVAVQFERFFRKFGGTLTPYYRAIWFKPLERFIYFAKAFHRVLRKNR